MDTSVCERTLILALFLICSIDILSGETAPPPNVNLFGGASGVASNNPLAPPGKHQDKVNSSSPL